MTTKTKTPKTILWEEVKADYNEWKMLSHDCACGAKMKQTHWNRERHYRHEPKHQKWIAENGYELQASVYEHYLMIRGRYFEHMATGHRAHYEDYWATH